MVEGAESADTALADPARRDPPRPLVAAAADDAASAGW